MNGTTAQLGYLQQATPQNRIAYWDRHKMAKDAGVTLNVYVPVEGDPINALILPGSAIVGLPTEGDPGRTLVYYEGDAFGRNMPFSEKLIHAVDRMVTRYPTIAAATPLSKALVPVGTYDVATATLTVEHQEILDEWTKVVP